MVKVKMLYIYLDQNKWIDLLRAEEAGTDHQFSDVLDAAKLAVEDGRVIFPLSLSHIMETWNHGNQSTRERLVSLMFSMADASDTGVPVTLANHEIQFQGQLEEALWRKFDTQDEPPEHQPFRRGYAQMMSNTSPLPQGWGPVERLFWAKSEELLVGEDLKDAAAEGDKLYRSIPDKLVRHEENTAAVLAASDGDERQQREYLVADTLTIFGESLDPAFRKVGLDSSVFIDMGVEGWEDLVMDIPVSHIYLELRYVRHRNRGNRAERNDMEDLSWLSVAIPYCDIIVMEKGWANLVRQSKLNQFYGTTVLTDLADLVPILTA